MDKKIAEEWIEALRSGNYSQTSLKLKSGKGYCCLGVLCDLAAQKGVGKWKPVPFDDTDLFVTENGQHSTVLPDEVVSWAGMNQDYRGMGSNGPYPRNGDEPLASHTCLSALNDDGASFEEIAQVIQEKVAVL